MEKTLVLDSSALISLSETCNAAALAFVKERCGVRLLAPESVFKETVETPSRIRKYGFSALRIKRLFDGGVVEAKKTDGAFVEELLSISNSLFSVGGRPLKLIQEGEAACVALMKQQGAKFLAIDEKTLRLLVEAPLKLRRLLQEEYEQEIEADGRRLANWRQRVFGIRVVRSSEILTVAAEKGFFKGFGADAAQAFHAAVYALRNAGCSLTAKELAAYSQLKIS